MFFFCFRGPREGTDGGFLPFFFRHSDEFRIHAFKFMGFPGNGGFQVFRGGSYMDLDIDGLHCCPQLFQNLVVVGGVDGFRLGGGFKQFLNKGLPFLGGFGGIGRVSGGGGAFARNGSFSGFLWS